MTTPHDESPLAAGTGTGTGSSAPDDPEQLRAEIEQTREQLGETVSQLVAKTDVKARTQATVAGLMQRTREKASTARHRGVQTGSAARDQLRSRTPDPVKHAMASGTARARRHRKPLAITAVVIAAGAMLARWRKKR